MSCAGSSGPRAARWSAAPPVGRGPPKIDARFLAPDDPQGRVIFTGFGLRGFAAKGKFDPVAFLPPFVHALWRAGVETRFAATRDQLRIVMAGAPRPPCIVQIYDEEHETDALARVDPLCVEAGLIFNSLATAAVVARKEETNRRHAAGGVRAPRMLDRLNPVRRRSATRSSARAPRSGSFPARSIPRATRPLSSTRAAISGVPSTTPQSG